MAHKNIAKSLQQSIRSNSDGNINVQSVKAIVKDHSRCEYFSDDTVHSSTDDFLPSSKYYHSKQVFCENLNMGEKSNPFGALITLICRTAKKSVNKIARIRRRKLSVLDEPKKQLHANEPPYTPTLQPRHSDLQCVESEQVDQKFNDSYELQHLIGQGGFAMVYSAIRIRDELPVAIKVIPKCNVYSFEELDGRSIPLEIYLHKDLMHTNIVRLYDFFEYSQAYVMVLERPTHHKDLFDYITEKKYLAEQEAREIFQQVVEAALYCESKGVFHRDIKDENLLLDTKTGVVKLFDFGSGSALENVLFTDYEGTRAYCPPEWFRFHRYYARPATVWSLGILLYNMIIGDVPFSNEVDIVRAEVHFCDNVSPELQDLIRRLLAKHPSHRPSLDDIKEHPWLRRKLPRPRTTQFIQQKDRHRYPREKIGTLHS